MARLGVDAGEVPFLIRSTLSQRHNVVDLICSRLIADVAYPHVPLEYALAAVLLRAPA